MHVAGLFFRTKGIYVVRAEFADGSSLVRKVRLF